MPFPRPLHKADLCHVSLVVALLVIFLHNLPTASAIGCFVCTSINGSEPDCEDTFNNTGRFYHQECFAGRKERSGLFPGTECIKMKAQLAESSYSVLIRACVVDNGDINSETEIGRIDHCGFINTMVYNDQQYRGCILTCQTDGCNTADTSLPQSFLTLVSLAFSGLLLPWLHRNFIQT